MTEKQHAGRAVPKAAHDGKRRPRPASGDGSPQAEKLPVPSDEQMERIRRANTVLLGQDAMPHFRPDHSKRDAGFEP